MATKLKFQENLKSTDDGFDYADATARAEFRDRREKLFLRTVREVLESDISVEEKLECITVLREVASGGFTV